MSDLLDAPQCMSKFNSDVYGFIMMLEGESVLKIMKTITCFRYQTSKTWSLAGFQVL